MRPSVQANRLAAPTPVNNEPHPGPSVSARLGDMQDRNEAAYVRYEGWASLPVIPARASSAPARPGPEAHKD